MRILWRRLVEVRQLGTVPIVLRLRVKVVEMSVFLDWDMHSMLPLVLVKELPVARERCDEHTAQRDQGRESCQHGGTRSRWGACSSAATAVIPLYTHELAVPMTGAERARQRR